MEAPTQASIRRLIFDLRTNIKPAFVSSGRLSGLVVRLPGYRSRGLGAIPGATGFSDK
jgi:hypothetical protein